MGIGSDAARMIQDDGLSRLHIRFRRHRHVVLCVAAAVRNTPCQAPVSVGPGPAAGHRGRGPSEPDLQCTLAAAGRHLGAEHPGGVPATGPTDRGWPDATAERLLRQRALDPAEHRDDGPECSVSEPQLLAAVPSAPAAAPATPRRPRAPAAALRLPSPNGPCAPAAPVAQAGPGGYPSECILTNPGIIDRALGSIGRHLAQRGNPRIQIVPATLATGETSAQMIAAQIYIASRFRPRRSRPGASRGRPLRPSVSRALVATPVMAATRPSPRLRGAGASSTGELDPRPGGVAAISQLSPLTRSQTCYSVIRLGSTIPRPGTQRYADGRTNAGAPGPR